jgi:transcriptional regulator with PAS, ATPase and Fis domain
VPCLLLLGETGTGKTLAAEWIARQLFPKQWERWEMSQQGARPLVPINVGTLPKNMVDIELFGSTPGAFTGASLETKAGLLEANCWEKVIFLDEIGEMEPESQVRLLKYLDSGEIRRVGDTEIRYFPSIIVAATNRPLDRWARTKDAPFRSDLFYRFDHIVKIPSLKERKEDLRLLISLLLQDSEINEQKKIERITLDAIQYLENADYPGNFRDLRIRIRNAVARAAAEGASTLCLRHLI